MNKTTLLRNLDACRSWAEKRRGAAGKAGEPRRAQDIMIGCVQAIAQCGQRIDGWLSRKGRKKVLQNIRERYNTPAGCRALTQLIDLAEGTVRACAWKDSFRTGALPLKYTPRKLTDSHKRAISEGMAREKNKRKTALKSRIEQEMGPDTGPS